MASSSRSSNSSWTARENKIFEDALASHDQYTQDRWQKIADIVGKSPEEVRRHYERLERDVRSIESGKVPYPYRSTRHNS